MMLDAVKYTLRGSSWPGVDDFAEFMMRDHGQTSSAFEKAFLLRYGDTDFDWPWFDAWRIRFKTMARRPESWDEFFQIEEDEDDPLTIKDALSSKRKSDLLAMAKQHGITVRSSEKIDAIRLSIAKELPRHVAHDVLQQFIAEENVRKEAVMRQRKRLLLYKTILGVDYAMERSQQLAEARFGYYVFRAEDDCPIHKPFDRIVLASDHPFWQHVLMPAYPDDVCRVLGASGPQTAKLSGGSLTKRLPTDWRDRLTAS